MENDSEEGKRRRPAVERDIKDITEADFRVRVIGTVVDTSPGTRSALLDDGTGRATVLFPDEDQFALLEEGGRYRVFGKVQIHENIEIEAELIQDMSDLDMGLLEQVRYITEKFTR